MNIDSSLAIYNPYEIKSKKQNSASKIEFQTENRLANNALAHFRVDEVQIQSLNGDKMEEAMSGLRNITMSLKEILNRNLKASNENISTQYDPNSIKTELSKSTNITSLHNYDRLSSKV
ncbi:MAG: hypothetical protein RL154_1094, partial [Pseudomonadota bacterium]